MRDICWPGLPACRGGRWSAALAAPKIRGQLPERLGAPRLALGPGPEPWPQIRHCSAPLGSLGRCQRLLSASRTSVAVNWRGEGAQAASRRSTARGGGAAGAHRPCTVLSSHAPSLLPGSPPRPLY